MRSHIPGTTYIRTAADQHPLETPRDTHFGQSRQHIEQQPQRAQSFAEIAREEQAALLSQSENQRGMHRT